MALVSTQPLTEMSTRNISWGKGGQCVGLTTLPPSCADCLEIWKPQGLSRPVMGLLYLYLIYSSTQCINIIGKGNKLMCRIQYQPLLVFMALFNYMF
jgi:hypothetical protein